MKMQDEGIEIDYSTLKAGDVFVFDGKAFFMTCAGPINLLSGQQEYISEVKVKLYPHTYFVLRSRPRKT